MPIPPQRPALLLTAFDRPGYLERVLRSWAEVPELGSWHLRVAVEPGPVAAQVVGLVEAFVARAGLVDVRVVVNPVRLGVAENPYRHLSELFDAGHDFVVRAEDDLVVADDVLRLFAHVATAYAADPRVATAYAFSPETDSHAGEPGALRRRPGFCPWVWGTWADRWEGLIGPTWDRDYSTYNDSPGFESGWDWNLNTRVLPARRLVSVAPVASRVDNIGVHGQHGTADNHLPTPSFRPRFAAERYVEVD